MRSPYPPKLAEENERLINAYINSTEDISVKDFFKREASKELLLCIKKREKRAQRMYKKGIIID